MLTQLLHHDLFHYLGMVAFLNNGEKVSNSYKSNKQITSHNLARLNYSNSLGFRRTLAKLKYIYSLENKINKYTNKMYIIFLFFYNLKLSILFSQLFFILKINVMKLLLKTLTWIGFFFKNQGNESAKICHFQYKMHTVRITWFAAFGHINSRLSLISHPLYNLKFTTLINNLSF